MDIMALFKFSLVDFIFTCAGLLCLLADIVLDVFATVRFYQEKEYVSLGLLLLFLVGSSVLIQVYSWLWYGYDGFKRKTKVESCLSQRQLKILHVIQLGIYVRHAGVVEMSLRSFFMHDVKDDVKDVAVFLNHDLSMLRLIETFSEGAPQLVLMLTLILRHGQLDPVAVLKAIGSASAIACSVTMYHRSLRSFVLEKAKQGIISSLVYFLWNLILISSRLTTLALFASVLPCFIFTHFLCSWLVLFFFAWRTKTNFMDSKCGEWLYRATVGLIWYFDWFNVVEGKTKKPTLLYHGFILADISLLCGLWYWKMSTEPPYFEIPQLYALITAFSIPGFYILGLLFKIIYYKCYHPNLAKEELKGGTSDSSRIGQGPSNIESATYWSWPSPQACNIGMIPLQISECARDADVPDSGPLNDQIETRLHSPQAPDVIRYNKRMRKLAENFYS